MLGRENTTKNIKERMEHLKQSEVCALFLLALDRKKKDLKTDEKDSEHALERAASLLARFFRATDIIGYMGKNQFAAFLTGKLTSKVIREKADTLTDALLFAEEDVSAQRMNCYVGVYVFREGQERSYEAVLRKAEYALEMAQKEEEQHFFIYGADGLPDDGLQGANTPISSRILMNYIDEGVRMLAVGETVETVYVSPGFYRRLSLPDNKDLYDTIQIHPTEKEDYVRMVREAAKSGQPREAKYRISADGVDWISCRVRLLRVSDAGSMPLVLEISHNISGLKQLKSQYDEKREWLRFMAEETDDQLWEVDLKAKVFRLLYTRDILEGRQTLYEDFPESLIQSGRIHKDSAKKFRRFAEEMYSGKAEGRENFIIQYRQTSCYGWSSLSYRMLYDTDGHPEKAIGIKEDLSYLPDGQSRFLQRRTMPPDMYPYLYCYFQANITRNLPEKLQLEGREQIRLVRYLTFDEILKSKLFRFFSPEATKKMPQRFQREVLLKEYAEGKRWIFEQCRVVFQEGSIQWVTVGANLSRDPESGDICLFAYLINQSSLRKWEAGLGIPMYRDPNTGIYDQKSYQSLVRYLLINKRQVNCALAQIWIGGAEELLRTDADPRLDNLMSAFHVILGFDCVVTRADRYSILVYFPNVGSRNHVKRRLENAFSFVRASLSDMKEMMALRFVAGAVLAPVERADYDEMLRSVTKLCTLHVGEPDDAVFFLEGERAYRWSGIELTEPLERMEIHTPDLYTSLSPEAKDVALWCLDWMLSADNADVSIDGVLQKLGDYYRADRAYILTLTERGKIVTMLNEWVGAGKYSIQHSISGKRTEQFPVIMRAALRTEPLILSMNKMQQEGTQLEPWKFAIFPMPGGEDHTDLLCIENPRGDIEEMPLFDRILPHLGGERERFARQTKESSPLDRLYAIPSVQSYQETVYSLNSDTCSSMGVMAIDIPELASIKIQKGYEYGSKFLLRISEVLLDVFSKFLIYHTQEAEFLVLCKNITYETFFNQCARARQLMGRKYFGQFRVGCIWSDGIFRANELVERARSIMKCVGSAEAVTPVNGQWNGFPQDNISLPKRKDLGRFMIFLQPKIDMRSGQMVGAEALVRIMDKKGNLLPHVRVIEEMEKEGTIQELDYFVFDKALDTMSQWEKKGYPLMPISSNFSRNTLLNPSSLASILAILSRYPDVPQELVELEITETAGDYGNQTFSDLITRFDDYGLQFSLDDFGSSYSNLSMITNLHFHSVKLDRSMIRDISGNPASRMLVRDIVKICGNSGMICIAEGVETQEQADMLLEDGCVFAQGYYYGRPMPLQEFEHMYFHKA